MPILSRKAVTYAWRELYRRALGGAGDQTEPAFYYGDPNDVDAPASGVIVIPAATSAWGELLAKPDQSLDTTDEDLPVLFAAQSGPLPFASNGLPGQLIIQVDIIATALFMLSRWEETQPGPRDQHERFPAAQTVAVRQGFIDRPIVDEYALLLRKKLQACDPDWQPKPARPSALVSHDIDHLLQFKKLRHFVGSTASQIFRRGRLDRVPGLLKEGFHSFSKPEQSRWFEAIQTLARLSEARGIQSDFYFMAASSPSTYESGYPLDQTHLKQCLADLQKAGHRIGLHPSYFTLDNPELLQEEKARLEACLDQTELCGGRQHYLRFNIPDSWHSWADSGLPFDSSMGFSEQEGFRCGTCHAYQPFDMERDEVIDIIERPLIAMDVTFKELKKRTPEQATKVLNDLIEKCVEVEGCFTLLWHNSSLHDDWQVWLPVYESALDRIADTLGSCPGNSTA